MYLILFNLFYVSDTGTRHPLNCNAINMNLSQEAFSIIVKDFSKFVTQVLSGDNQGQKKLLKMNLQALQNLCESLEMLNQSDSDENQFEAKDDNSEKLNTDTNEKVIDFRKLLLPISIEDKKEVPNEATCETKVGKRPLASEVEVIKEVAEIDENKVEHFSKSEELVKEIVP